MLSSPLIFAAMYIDYFYKYAAFYLVVIVFPVIFIRRFKHLIALVLVSCIVSSILVHVYMPPDTAPFFVPFDNILEVLVILEAVFFGLVQALLLFLIHFLIKTIKSARTRKGM
ncbi:hypothetical protein [Paenibacillus dokdonensis]|uniref:hypothetical protein n=1 Tax=Paenibacillus dokdonensis TaxID=2567944 RepID=UPI003D2D5F39